MVTGTVGFTPPVAFSATAGPEGTWSAQVVVPLGTPAGSYPVNASCGNPSVTNADVSGQAINFAYAPASLTVAVAAAPKFTG